MRTSRRSFFGMLAAAGTATVASAAVPIKESEPALLRGKVVPQCVTHEECLTMDGVEGRRRPIGLGVLSVDEVRAIEGLSLISI